MKESVLDGCFHIGNPDARLLQMSLMELTDLDRDDLVVDVDRDVEDF